MIGLLLYVVFTAIFYYLKIGILTVEDYKHWIILNFTELITFRQLMGVKKIVLLFFKVDLLKMSLIGEVLDFLQTLIQSTVEETIKINKANLVQIENCLQDAQDKIEFL